MTFAFASLDGPIIHCSKARPRSPTPDARQAMADRHSLWLSLYEVGLPHPVHPKVKKPRRMSRPDIARMFGVSRETIRTGLLAARATRALLRRLDAGH